MARGGRLTRHLDSKSLQDILGEMYRQNHTHLWSGLLHRGREKEGAQ